MAFSNMLRRGVGDQAPNDSQELSSVENPNSPVASKTAATDSREAGGEFTDKDVEALPSRDAQRGVQNIQAVTLAWTKKSLAALLILYVHASIRYACAFVYS